MVRTRSTESAARREVIRYLTGDIDANTLVRRFGRISWELGERRAPTLRALVGDIQLSLDEYTSGHWTEVELRELLRGALSTFSFELSPRPSVRVRSQADSPSRFSAPERVAI